MIPLCQKKPTCGATSLTICTCIHLSSALANPEGNKGSNLHGEFATKSQANYKTTEVFCPLICNSTWGKFSELVYDLLSSFPRASLMLSATQRSDAQHARNMRSHRCKGKFIFHFFTGLKELRIEWSRPLEKQNLHFTRRPQTRKISYL